MKLFRFDSNVTREIRQYGSQGLSMAPILRAVGPARVDVMYIEPSGLVGGHPATATQLFLVVNGSGWVRDRHNDRIAIDARHAALWAAGEWHESGTEHGMTVIVIEGEAVNPHDIMPELLEA